MRLFHSRMAMGPRRVSSGFSFGLPLVCLIVLVLASAPLLLLTPLRDAAGDDDDDVLKPVVSWWIEHLGDERVARGAGPVALAGCGTLAIEPLTNALAAEDPNTRVGAALALGLLGTTARSAASALVRVVKEDDGAARRAALAALGEVGVATDEDAALLAQTVAGDEPVLSLFALRGLRISGRIDPGVLEGVVPLLAAEDWHIAQEVFGLMKESETLPLDVLRETALGAATAQARLLALSVIAHARPEDPVLPDALRPFFEDEALQAGLAFLPRGVIDPKDLQPAIRTLLAGELSEQARRLANRILASHEADAPASREELLAALDDPDPEKQAMALFALVRKHPQDPKLKPQVEARIEAANPLLRFVALTAAAELKLLDRSHLPLLLAALEQPDVRVAAAAIEGLSSASLAAEPKVVKALLEAAKSGERLLASAACRALLAAGVDHPEVLEALAKEGGGLDATRIPELEAAHDLLAIHSVQDYVAFKRRRHSVRSGLLADIEMRVLRRIAPELARRIGAGEVAPNDLPMDDIAKAVPECARAAVRGAACWARRGEEFHASRLLDVALGSGHLAVEDLDGVLDVIALPSRRGVSAGRAGDWIEKLGPAASNVLRARIESGTGSERDVVLQGLRGTGNAGVEAMRGLAAGADRRVRDDALAALAGMGEPGWDALADLLEVEEPHARVAAADALLVALNEAGGRARDQDSLSAARQRESAAQRTAPLEARAKAPASVLVAWAAQRGPDEPPPRSAFQTPILENAIPVWIAYVGATVVESEWDRPQVRWRGSPPRLTAAHVPMLVERLSSRAACAQVCGLLAGLHVEARAAIPALQRVADEEGHPARIDAALALAEIDPSDTTYLPLLAGFLEESASSRPGPNVGAAQDVLGRWGEAARTAADVLARLAKMEAGGRWPNGALRALVRVEGITPRTRELLDAASGPRTPLDTRVDAAGAVLLSGGAQARRAAALALAQALPQVRDYETRVRLLRALGEFGDDAAPAAEAVISMLPTLDADLATQALVVIGAPAVTALARMLEREERNIQAATALARIGGPAVPALTGLLSSPSEPARFLAAAALAAIGPDAAPAIPALKQAAAQLDDPAGAMLLTYARVRAGDASAQMLLEVADLVARRMARPRWFAQATRPDEDAGGRVRSLSLGGEGGFTLVLRAAVDLGRRAQPLWPLMAVQVTRPSGRIDGFAPSPEGFDSFPASAEAEACRALPAFGGPLVRSERILEARRVSGAPVRASDQVGPTILGLGAVSGLLAAGRDDEGLLDILLSAVRQRDAGSYPTWVWSPLGRFGARASDVVPALLDGLADRYPDQQWSVEGPGRWREVSPVLVDPAARKRAIWETLRRLGIQARPYLSELEAGAAYAWRPDVLRVARAALKAVRGD